MDLTEANIPAIREAGLVSVPSYDRASTTDWILHLGVGGFSRSHLFMLTDSVEEANKDAAGARWGICGVGLMPWDRKMMDTLKSQDHMYTLVTRDSEAGDKAQVIRSVCDFFHAADDYKAALDRLASPSTGIVSLTVTEKGYCLNATGSLDFENDLVKHDLSKGGLDEPRSAPGLVIAGLRLRRERKVPPFTVLSCDNLPSNGKVCRTAVIALANRADPELGAWIAANVNFPSSMVDRITPVTTDTEKALVKDSFGIMDQWPVVAEPFVQWVCEDSFGPPGKARRPAWENCPGVMFVEEVEAYELMKLRLLNSTHSALSYPSLLCGYDFVHDAMADPLVCSYVERYMAALAPTVPPISGVDLGDYQEALIGRFSNSRIADTLLRLASDGSTKFLSTISLGGLAHSALGAMHFPGSGLDSSLPLFTKYVRSAEDLAALQGWRADHRKWRQGQARGAKGELSAAVSFLPQGGLRPAEEPPPDAALALAAWIGHMGGLGEGRRCDDPNTGVLQPIAAAAVGSARAGDVKKATSLVAQYLSTALGDSAASWPELSDAVQRWLSTIATRGIRAALTEALAKSPVPTVLPDQKSARAKSLKVHQRRLQHNLSQVDAVARVTEQAQQAAFDPPSRAAVECPASPTKAKPARALELKRDNLQQIREQNDVDIPEYASDAATHWIMHIGVGGFSRSHMFMLTDSLLHTQSLQASPEPPAEQKAIWNICGVGLMPWDVKMRDILKQQDYMYTLVTRDSVAGDSARVIRSVGDFIHAPDDYKAALDRLASPSTGIVSLTVTEKGYCLNSQGDFDFENDLIKHDLSEGGLDEPRSAPGLVIAALRLRRERKVPPFTVLSCDNLPSNGQVCRSAVLALATRADLELAGWIAANVSFPSAMVDRITPATTDAERALVKESFGIADQWPVVAEPFLQWVVEDDFGPAGRPAWESCAGVQFVADVIPYELMKLRLLNSSHSALAYPGILCGHDLVHDAMADPLLCNYLVRYMAALAPTVPPVPGVNIGEYQATLIQRFSNARVADRLSRLAQDGSVKFQSFLALGGLAHSALGAMHFSSTEFGNDLPLFTKIVRSLGDFVELQNWRASHRKWRRGSAAGAKGEIGHDMTFLPQDATRIGDPPPAPLAFALASWIRYMTGTLESGEEVTLDDPKADVLQPLACAACAAARGAQGSQSCQGPIEQFLQITLGDAASAWPQLSASVRRWLQTIVAKGCAAALAEMLTEGQDPSSGSVAGSGLTVDRTSVLKSKRKRLESELGRVSAALHAAESGPAD